MAVNTRKLVTLGKRIRNLRKEKKLTQEQLATEIRVTSAYVGFIEQGKRNPSLNTLDMIARALGVKMSDLLK